MRRPYLPVCVLALLVAPTLALAFETVDAIPPHEVFLEAGQMYDTNILRRSAGTENENVFRFGGGGRLDQRIYGRQGLRLEGRADYYMFDNFDNLNHVAYNGAATWL